MRVSFDFLSETIKLEETKINTLCIENTALFRAVITAFYKGETEESNIIFSHKYEPFKFKGNICYIHDYFDLSYSTSIMKKLYESIEKYCNNELYSETQKIKTELISFMDLIVNAYDYDFEYNFDITIPEMLKMVGLKPSISEDTLLGSVLDFIVITNKYIKTKCFVLPNLHIFFSHDEIEKLYSDLINNHITTLIIENKKSFTKSEFENLYIYDEDFCEIVEK